MGLSLRNIGKKIGDIAGGVERQVNVFDNNKTYANKQGGGADFATRYSPQHVAVAVGEGIQKTFTPLYQPIVRTIPELGGSIASPFKPDSRTPHGVLEEALFGKEPIQNIQAKVATNYKAHANLPTWQRVGLAGGEAAGSLVSDLPIPVGAGISKGVKLATKELRPAVNLIKDTPLNEIGAVGKDVKAPKVNLAPETNVAQLPITPVRGPDVAPVKVGLKTEFQKKFVDRDAVLLNQLKAIDKANPVPKNQISRVNQFMVNSNLTRGSNAVANQDLEDSPVFKAAIGGMKKKDYRAFSDYANARRELSEVDRAKATSRPVEELRATVDAGDNNPEFVKRFQSLNQHYKSLADVAHAAGIIDSDTLAHYAKNDNYVRLQRDMGDLLPSTFGKGASYNLGSTTITKKFKGSKRSALPAGEVAASYTQQVYREAAKNITATHLMDNLTAHGLATKLDNAAAARHENVVRLLRDGKQEYYKVSAPIKEAVNNINPYTMNVVMQILAAPGRVFRAGVTGLNPVFIARNLLKDQAGTAINSEHLMSTHSPKNFFGGLYGASKGVLGVNHEAEWQAFRAHYGDLTSYDLTRNAKSTKQLVNSIRGGNKVKIVQKLKSPIRTLEDVASVTEKSTRFQNFRGEYRVALKQGLPSDQAYQKAAIGAWQNSVDFARAGEWGRVLNQVLPYWNPATQGVRQMGRTFARQPIKSVFTGTAILGVPIATATAYNLSRPDLKAQYDQIPENEKDNNIVILNPDAKGGYIKVPLPPGYKDAFMPIRRALEAFNHDKPVQGQQIAQDILQTVTGPVSIQTKDQVVGSFIPQAVKPFVQQEANKDFFTSKPIVQPYIQNATDINGQPIAESKKSYQNTSGTAQLVGKKLNLSPIRLEKAVKDVGGTVGQNVLNASDNVLAAKGKIPKEQISGMSIKGGFKKSFTGNTQQFNKSEGAKYYAKVNDFSNTLTPQEKTIFNKIAPNKKNFLGDKIFQSQPLTKSSDYADLLANPSFLDKYQTFNKSQKDHDPLWDLDSKQLRAYMNAQVISKFDPGGDGTTTRQLYDTLPDDFFDKRTTYFDALKAKGVKFDDSKTSLRPGMPKDLQSFADSYAKLPYGTGARSSALRSAQGVAYIAWLDQNRIYNNQQRADLGLPPLADESSKYGSSGGGGSSGGSIYKYSVALNAGGKAKKVSVSVKGGAAPKGKKVARPKPKVSIKKSLV